MLRRVTFELDDEFLDVEAMAREHEMYMVGQNRTRVDYESTLARISRETAGDGAGLNAGEFDRRKLQRFFGGQASLPVVRTRGQRTGLCGLRGAAVAEQYPCTDEVGPGTARVVR